MALNTSFPRVIKWVEEISAHTIPYLPQNQLGPKQKIHFTQLGCVLEKHTCEHTVFPLEEGGGYLVFCEREGSQDPAQIISKFGGFPILHNFKKKK